jgi:hypothetical protein
MEGSHLMAEEPFVDLYEHNLRLKGLTRFDWGTPLMSLGGLGLGGAIGALAAGADFVTTGVLTSLGVGVGFVLAGFLLRIERAKAVRDVYELFDQRLSLYTNTTATAIRQQLAERAAEQITERSLLGKLQHVRKAILGT